MVRFALSLVPWIFTRLTSCCSMYWVVGSPTEVRGNEPGRGFLNVRKREKLLHTLASRVVAHWLQTSFLCSSRLKVFESQAAECGEKARVAGG